MLAALGELSGTVFEDLDGDGVYDVGEPGLPDWTVELRREGVGNQLRQSLLSPAPIPGEQLGFRIAARNDRVLVGAREADLEAVNAGAAYLFDGIDGRLLQSLRKPAPAATDDYFGHDVAIVGEAIYVAAWGVDLNGSNSGLVYAFDGATGGLQGTIQQPPPCWGDNFGYAMAAVGSNLLVGARNDDATGLSRRRRLSLRRFDGRVAPNVSEPHACERPTTSGSRSLPLQSDFGRTGCGSVQRLDRGASRRRWSDERRGRPLVQRPNRRAAPTPS